MNRNWLVVCSDETAGDNFDSDQSEVLDLGFSVTTSPDEISGFLTKNDDCVVFSTYQSSDKISQGSLSWGGKFDLIIADECHRTVGTRGSNFGIVLDDLAIPAMKKLFMTATPRTISPKLKMAAQENDIEVSSMDDATVYGEVLFQYSFNEAISAGYLAKYEIIVAAMDKKSIKDLVPGSGGAPFANEVIILKSLKDFSVNSAITYHSRLSAAEKFSQSIKKVNELMPAEYQSDLDTGYVNGQMRTRQKSNLLRKLQDVGAGKTYLLTNARCLTEGIDVPNLDAVCFVDPRTSMVDIVQAVGRVLRKGNNAQKIGKIIIPIFVDDLTDPDQEFSQTKFAGLWKVICALESHDESLRDEMQNIRLGLSNSPGSSVLLPEELKIVVPVNAGNIAEFSNSISLKIVERVTSDWELGFSHLKAYAELTGDANPSQSTKDQFNFPIGSWCTTQRSTRKGKNRGVLNRERIEKLDGIGFEWNPLEASWNQGFENLKLYISEYGHSNPPSGTLFPGEYKLGQWVQVQRVNQKQGILSTEKQEKLSNIGLSFEPKIEQRQELLDQLQTYFNEFGTVNVPTKYVSADGYKLGSALDRIRQLKKNSPDSDHEAIAFLESKDIIWNVKDREQEESFRLGISELDGYLAKFSVDSILQTTVCENGFKLGAWLGRMRSKHASGNLSMEHQDQLTSRGVELNLKQFEYSARLRVLQEFYKANGHIRVPQELKPEGLGSIYQWLKGQKKRKREGLLTAEEIAALDRFGFIWENENELIKQEAWERFISELSIFIESTGSANVPKEYRTKDGYALGSVVSKHRTLRRKGELSENKVAELESLGFLWEIPRPKKFESPRIKVPKENKQRIERRVENHWDKFVAALKRYKAVHGDLTIPATYKDDSNFALGQAAVDLRTAFRRGELHPEKVKELNLLNFPWEVSKPSNADYYWSNFIIELENFKREFGNLDIPNSYVSPSGFKLGDKARYTRTMSNKGELNKARVEELSALGFIWSRMR
jgi:superfamily II DNA or RNA helicase